MCYNCLLSRDEIKINIKVIELFKFMKEKIINNPLIYDNYLHCIIDDYNIDMDFTEALETAKINRDKEVIEFLNRLSELSIPERNGVMWLDCQGFDNIYDDVIERYYEDIVNNPPDWMIIKNN